MMTPDVFVKKAWRKCLTYTRLLWRNKFIISGAKVKRNQVNLEWVSNHNLGDELAPVIYQWMLNQKGIQQDTKANRTVHLMTVGSMVGSWNFDAVVWGSGVHMIANIWNQMKMRHIQKYDIRAVRGPITRLVFTAAGYDCPEVYGDPAILLPLIYPCKTIEKNYDVSVILHYHADNKTAIEERWENSIINFLNIGTTDYEVFIDELLASKKVISSSLHGIILAESFGVPAVFLNTGGYVDSALMKYYDWYYSTNRWSVKMARSIEEAMSMNPMELPDLEGMRRQLMQSFPYDLWPGQTHEIF